MRSILPADCARARQQLSLSVDSELSEFELVLLEAHLARCDDCRAFEHGVKGFTIALRASPVETPSISFQPPRRRARLDVVVGGALRAGSAAAAIAVVAISGLIALNGSSPAVSGVDLAQAREVLDLHERQLRRLDGLAKGQTRVPRGLAAAETIEMRFAPSSRRLQGRR
ncbi:MAG TPA: zf-HC2 domain-containing protein [Gaiellaceae bacterium]|nr:zf-HC2 domain-containing protein [Gaiellaceae bacterium]